MFVVSLRRLLVAGAAVLATGLAAVPANAASPAPSPRNAHGPWLASKSSVHAMRPVGSTAGPTVGSPSVSGAKRDAPSGSGPLTYGGGFVQTVPRLIVDFWGSDFNTDTDAGGFTGAQGATYLTDFLNEFANSAWLSSQTQYCESIPPFDPPMATNTIASCGNEPHAGAPFTTVDVWNDTNAVSPTGPTFAQIGAEADAARAHFSFAPNLVDLTVMVVSPPGKSTFSDPTVGGSFCAFHAFTQTTIFAYQPWSPDAGASCHTNEVNATNGPLGQGHFDGLSISGGHEIAEVMTDPLPGVAITQNGPTTFGWLDSAGFETGDKCSRLQIWPERDITFGADFFAVQPLYSDDGQVCSLEGLGGLTGSRTAIAAQDATHRDVFVRGVDGAIWTRSTSGAAWTGFSTLNGFTSNAPGAVSWGPGRLDLFVRGSDGALWHRPWTNTTGWGAWETLGGVITSAPAAASWAVNRLDVVARGLDNGLWRKSWNGTAWTPWEGLGGIVTADPGAVSTANNSLDLFVRGNDNALWHKAWTGSSFTAWQPMGGLFTGGPTAAATAASTFQVSGIGIDGAIWRMTCATGTCGAFQSLGGSWNVDPTAISAGGGPVEYFNVGLDGSTQRLLLGL